MIAMRILIPPIISLLLLASCSNSSNITGDDFNKIDDYKLIEMDAYSFRRAYHDSDTLAGEELDAFMNRNPELMEDYMRSENKPFYAALCETGLFQNHTLSLKDVDTLPEQFNFHLSLTHILTVKTNYLENPKEVETPSMELTFLDKNEIVLIDTLAFDWPPDITFMKVDLDKDGTDELISIYRWYIVNGDNFDVKIYKLRK